MTELLLGLILTLLITPALIWAAHNYGLLDHPDERKHHKGAIPVVGGLAMALGMALPAIWYLTGDEAFWWTFVALAIVVVIGFLDDWKGLPVHVRFAGQGTAAAIVAIAGGVQLSHLGDLLGMGTVVLGMASIPLTIFAVVGTSNALNLSDGMDGLAGGLALIAALFIGLVAHDLEMQTELTAMLILGGALTGFLFFNMRLPWQRRAKVFMGDSGSLMLGFLLGFAVIAVTQQGTNPLPPAAALWFFAIPLMDTVSLMIRRMLKGRSPFHPGRDHLHHILLRVGYDDSQVVRFIHLVALAFALVGYLGWRLNVPDAVLFYSFMGVFALYFYGVKHAWKLMRLIVPLHAHHQPEVDVSEENRAR